ncbi:MAG: hypothetical protein P1V21_04410 [Rhizobiaceae bacterium]|nr:hypothetical protein [Rhizobiaceae bacterium]
MTMKIRMLSLIFGLAMCLNPAHAQQSGKAALDEWLEDQRAFGVESSYDAVESAGDTLIVSGLHFSFSTTFELPDAKATSNLQGPVDLVFRWRTPRLTATGLTADDDGFFADTMSLSSDTTFGFEVRQAQETILDMQGTIEDYVLNGYGWPRIPKIDTGPKRPISRWMPYLEVIKDYRLDLGGYSLLTIDFTFAGLGEDVAAIMGHIESRDAFAKGMIDGRLAEYRDGGSIQETIIEVPDGQPVRSKTQTGQTSLMGLDYLAFVNVLNSDGTNTRDYRPYIDRYEVQDQQTDDGTQTTGIKRLGIEGASIRLPETNMMAMADALYLAATQGSEPEEVLFKKALIAVLDLYRSFAVKRVYVEEMTASADLPEFMFGVELGEMEWLDVSSSGLGKMSVRDVNVTSGADQIASIGGFHIGPIEFPAYGPIRDYIADFDVDGKPDPMAVARLFTPTSMAFELSDLFAINPETGSDITLDHYALELNSTLPPVPTTLDMSISGWEMPLSDLKQPDVAAMLQLMGLEKIRLSQNLSLRWDEASEDLVVEDVMIDVGDIGTVRANVRFGGVPRALFEHPDQAEKIFQSAIFTASFKSAEFELVDDGGLKAALSVAAMSQNMPEEIIVEVGLRQLEAELAKIGNAEFSSMILAAVAAFLEDPQSLRIVAAPENPVAAVALMGAATMAPQEIPELLNLSIFVNE